MSLEGARDGLLLGLLRAERELREMAEHRARELARVMTEVALRVDGAIMEEMRRQDPRAPESWGPEQWRAFFARALEARWGASVSADEAVRELREEIRRLRERIRELERSARTHPQEPEGPRSSPSSPMPAPDLYDPYHDLALPELPAAPPPRFGALQGRWRRGAMAVALAAGGICARQEILDRIARAEGIGSKSGSLKRLIEDLAEEGFLRQRTLELPLGAMKTRIVVVELGERGRELAEAMGWEIREGDLGRLRRLHQGDELEAHTAAVLVFLYQARVRGWRGQAMPDVPGPAVPDARVTREGEQWYVEVERSTAEKAEKWRNLAALQGGVAMCAPDPEARARLVADCRAMGLGGVATDIVSLLKGHETLWIERW